jgi:hypothetical protein
MSNDNLVSEKLAELLLGRYGNTDNIFIKIYAPDGKRYFPFRYYYRPRGGGYLDDTWVAQLYGAQGEQVFKERGDIYFYTDTETELLEKLKITTNEYYIKADLRKLENCIKSTEWFLNLIKQLNKQKRSKK